MKQTIQRKGFSLIELVIVVVIIAIIAAIAVPKMSRGAAGANDAALMQNLSQMRSAIDMFATEHGGVYPGTTAATFNAQMTQYSDVTGTTTSASRTGTCIYGPYLKAIPTLPVGSSTVKGLSNFTSTGPAGTGAFAWYYDGTTIWANTGSVPATDSDAAGKAYNTY